jgi:asparagine synthase (glutamine-hydrolysing)
MNEIFEVPLTDPTAYFFDESGNIARDPGELGGPQRQPDRRAVFSVLQFGAIVPPLSPWCGVSRLIPGYQYRGTTRVGTMQVECSAHVAHLDPEEQSDEISRAVDNAICDAIGDGPDPVVLFSGGVDSGLIAARLAALGRRDALLLNYSFGEADSESHLAEAMAKHLGLRFERLAGSCGLCDCLIEPGRVYFQPFADYATASTFSLAHAVIDRLAEDRRLILDGTGADSAFGLIDKIERWKRVMHLPAAARDLASGLYRITGLWHRNGRSEYVLRTLRRSATMPLLSAFAAQNPLADIFYDGTTASDVHRLLIEWISDFAGDSVTHRVIAEELAFGVPNAIVPKAVQILESAGLRVSFPFLRRELVSLALASVDNWQMDEPKAPLKRCLARHVPHAMVYRPKGGFVDPYTPVFHTAQFIAYLRAAADSAGPIASMLRKKPLMKACDLLARGAALPCLTLNSLWAITFLDRWYRTATRKSPAEFN